MIDRRERALVVQNLPRPPDHVLFAGDLNQPGEVGAAPLFDARDMRLQKLLDREAVAAIDHFAKLRASPRLEFQEVGDAVEKIDMRKRDAKPAEAERRQDFRRDQQDLDVGYDAGLADLFEAELMELSRGSFGRLVVAKNLAGVAKPDRAPAFDEARGHRARDERSQLRPQRQQRAVTVDEAICPLGLLLAHPAREQVVVIEHRQYDLVIRPAREDFHSASFDEAAQSYFVVEEILDACRNFGKRRHM